MRSAAGSRFPQLDDAGFWRSHGSQSDTAIAAMLGASRETVRLARRRNGVPALARGRQRGSVTVISVRRHGDLDSTEGAVIDRIRRDRERKTPATETTLSLAIHAAHQARLNGQPSAYDDALLDISSAAALIHDHRQKLKRAA